jgi:hypothetical protein
MWFANEGDDWLNEPAPKAPDQQSQAIAGSSSVPISSTINLEDERTQQPLPLHTLPEAPQCSIRMSSIIYACIIS